MKNAVVRYPLHLELLEKREPPSGLTFAFADLEFDLLLTSALTQLKAFERCHNADAAFRVEPSSTSPGTSSPGLPYTFHYTPPLLNLILPEPTQQGKVLPIDFDPPTIMSQQAQRADAKNILNARIGINLTNRAATVTYEFHGASSVPLCNLTWGPINRDFTLGTGDARGTSITLCDQDLRTMWSVKGRWNGAVTEFIESEVKMPSTAYLHSTAWLNNVTGSATSTTKFKVGDFTANPIPATLPTKPVKKASVESGLGTQGCVFGQWGFDRNVSVAMQLSTEAKARDGGSVTFDAEAVADPGLTLLAGAGQAVDFHVSFNDYITPTQSFYWSVSWDGFNLTTVNIDSGLFEPINGGYFLPYSSVPGSDVTENLSGQVDFWARDDAQYGGCFG